jgi:hypothetical protein
LQLSSVVQLVPRTVALELRPRVRKRPWALPNSRRRLFAAPVTGLFALAAVAHPLKSPPVSFRSVRPSLCWLTTNAPFENTPLWVPFDRLALVSRTLPFVVSIRAPSLIAVALRSLNSRLPRGFTFTTPPAGLTTTVWRSFGLGAADATGATKRATSRAATSEYLMRPG